MTSLGIIGLERSGKTSLFNAVAMGHHEVGFQTHQDPHLGVIKVPDERLDQLSAMFQPKKHTEATLEYVDFPGGGFGGGSGPDIRFLDRLSQMDALIHVVRGFQNDSVPHPRETVDPARDIETMMLELTFADMALVEKRLDRIASESKALKAAERDLAEREVDLLRRLLDELGNGAPVRAMALSEDERKDLRQYRFLTDRPLLTLINIDEGQAGDNVGLLLRGTDKDEVERGQVISEPASITPHTKCKAETYILKKEEGGRHTPFFNGYRPQFYFRTTDVTGTVDLPEGTEMVMPGDNVSMQMNLITPIAMEKGLRFAIREGGHTVGAGTITEIIE